MPPSPTSFRDSLRDQALSIGRPLSQAELHGMETHYRLLLEWSRRMNLTGLKDEQAMIRRHFLEPIEAVRLLENDGRLVDLGSGAGFPAIPLKILRPGLDLVLVESSEKKSAFLWAVLRTLRLERARVETRRVRDAADLADLLPCRYLTLRAIRGGDLLEGGKGPILERNGKGLWFASAGQEDEIRKNQPPGLRFSAALPLPSAPKSIVIILEPLPAP